MQHWSDNSDKYNAFVHFHFELSTLIMKQD